MSVLWWFLAVLVVAIPGLILDGRTIEWSYGDQLGRRYRFARWYRGWPLAITVVSVVIVACSPLYYEFPSQPYSVPATFENGQIVLHPYGMFTHKFMGSWGNVLLKDVVLASCEMKISPISENPKVRPLKYVVEVKVVDQDQLYSKLERRQMATGLADGNSTSGVNGEIKHLTLFQLYEFNEKHSKELATLYNPMDKKQQEKFREWVSSFLDPILAKEGCAVSRAQFELQ